MALALQPLALPLVADDYGVILVQGTRVPIDVLIYDYRAGATAEEIAAAYPTVRLADVHAVLSYYLQHQREVDAYLEERERRSDEQRQEVLQRSPQAGLRERLRSRLK